MRHLLLVFLTLALAASVACGGDSKDASTKEVAADDLAAMVLPLAELGDEYAGFQLDDESGFHSNAAAVAGSDDPEEAEDVEKFGRINGFENVYFSASAYLNNAGVYIVSTQVELFGDGDGASGYLRDKIADMRAAEGTTRDRAYYERIEDFDPGTIGDEALATTAVISGTLDDGTQTTIWGTFVAFRIGPVFCGASVGRTDEADARQDAIALAQKLEERVDSVLAD